jgi:hypothetical protein
MKFILIILVVFDMHAGTWGSIATAEFDSREACIAAAEAFKQLREEVTFYIKACGVCMPKEELQRDSGHS